MQNGQVMVILYISFSYNFCNFNILGKLIMLVIRTLERQKNSSKSVRRQHLFVINNPYLSDIKPLYVISWGSKFSPKKCVNIDNNDNNINSIRVRDGNHPNWIPDTHQISMNLHYNNNNNNNNNNLSHYNLVKFDIDNLMDIKTHKNESYMKQIYHLGSGHPTLTSKVIYFI